MQLYQKNIKIPPLIFRIEIGFLLQTALLLWVTGYKALAKRLAADPTHKELCECVCAPNEVYMWPVCQWAWHTLNLLLKPASSVGTEIFMRFI